MMSAIARKKAKDQRAEEKKKSRLEALEVWKKSQRLETENNKWDDDIDVNVDIVSADQDTADDSTISKEKASNADEYEISENSKYDTEDSNLKTTTTKKNLDDLETNNEDRKKAATESLGFYPSDEKPNDIHKGSSFQRPLIKSEDLELVDPEQNSNKNNNIDDAAIEITDLNNEQIDNEIEIEKEKEAMDELFGIKEKTVQASKYRNDESEKSSSNDELPILDATEDSIPIINSKKKIQKVGGARGRFANPVDAESGVIDDKVVDTIKFGSTGTSLSEEKQENDKDEIIKSRKHNPKKLYPVEEVYEETEEENTNWKNEHSSSLSNNEIKKTNTLLLDYNDINSNLNLLSNNESKQYSILLSFLMVISSSEFYDSTFIISSLMVMKESSITVFTSTFLALSTITIISSLIGYMISNIISIKLIHLIGFIYFLMFGFKKLKDSHYKYKFNSESQNEKIYEIQSKIDRKDMLSPSSMDFLERGEMIKDKPRRFAYHRSTVSTTIAHATNVADSLTTPMLFETFKMVLLSGWSDSPHLAIYITTLAAGTNYYSVIIGSLIGYFLTTLIAVVGGKLLVEKFNMRHITSFSGVCSLFFAFIYFCNVLSD